MLLRGGAEVVTRAGDVIELAGRVGELAEDPPRPVTPLDGLSADQRQVYEALPGRGVVTVDQVAKTAGLAPAQVLAPLAMLELAGLVQRRDGSWGSSAAAGSSYSRLGQADERRQRGGATGSHFRSCPNRTCFGTHDSSGFGRQWV